MTFTPMGESEKIELSVGMVRTSLVKPTREGQMPTMAQIINFVMLCKSRALNPYVGDAYLVGYDTRHGAEFSLITSVQALLKRGENNPNYDGMQHGIIVATTDGHIENRVGAFRLDEERLLGGWCCVYRTDRSVHELSTLRLSGRVKDTPNWRSDPEGMIEKCAIAAALRKAFPTQTGGLYLQEELEHDPDAVGAIRGEEQEKVNSLQDLTRTLNTPSMRGPGSMPAPGTVPGIAPQASPAAQGRAQAAQATPQPPKPPQASETPQEAPRRRKPRSTAQKPAGGQKSAAQQSPPQQATPKATAEPPKQEEEPPFEPEPEETPQPVATDGAAGDLDSLVAWTNYNYEVETAVLAPDGFDEEEGELIVKTRSHLQQYGSADDVILGAEDLKDELEAAMQDALTDRQIDLIEAVKDVYVARLRE